MSNINRIRSLDDIYNIYEKMSQHTKSNIINLSDWQVSKYYEESILKVLNISHVENFIRYEYTYNINKQLNYKLKEKLGIGETQNFIISANNTLSILMIANMLKQVECKSLCLVKPMYFSTYESLNLLDVPYKTKAGVIKDNKMFLPSIKELEEFDYIWITSPFFCSSIYFQNEDIKKLKYLQENGKTIIADEAYSYVTCCLSKKSFSPNITILSPSKAISINGLKFSTIIYDEKYDDLFNQWTDVLHGNLSISNTEAIRHFLSINYEECFKYHLSFIEKALKEIKQVLLYYPDFKLLDNTLGNMIMIYNSKIKFNIINQKNFFHKMMSSTNAFILPGYFHDYCDKNGFCFRINLCLYEKKYFIPRFINILEFLMTFYKVD